MENNTTTNEIEQEIDLIASELNDQNDFLTVLVTKIEELYKLKEKNNFNDFQFGFHLGEFYKHLQQFQSETQVLNAEIISFLKGGIKQPLP
jgi:hypothetical protein